MPTITTAFPPLWATAKKFGVTKSRLIWIEKQAAAGAGQQRTVRIRKKKPAKTRF